VKNIVLILHFLYSPVLASSEIKCTETDCVVQCATQWQTKIGPQGSIKEMRLLCFCGVVTLEYHIHSQILHQPFCFLIPLRYGTKKFIPNKCYL